MVLKSVRIGACMYNRGVGAELCEYAPIPSLPGYTVSKYGEIFSPKGRPVKQQPDGNGGLKVNVGKTTVGVHNVVLRAFTGGHATGWRVKHVNGDRSDNRLENLAWAKTSGKAVGGGLWGFAAKLKPLTLGLFSR